MLGLSASADVRWRLLPVLLVFCLAVLPRVLTLGRGLTTDEAYHWVAYRSADFLSAISAGRFADTMITGHPGVTTMWLGSIGLLLEQSVGAGLKPTPTGVGASTGLNPAPTGASFEMHLTLMRLPVAVATSLIVVAGYVLLRRILGPTVALIAALLWATDPFLVAHSRLLHLDGMLTMLMLLATLALLAACFTADGARVSPRWPLLILAGIATGLALLTKSLAILLAPIALLILITWGLLAPCHRLDRLGNKQSVAIHLICGKISGSWFLVLGSGLGVLLPALITAFLAWPALWVTPSHAIGSVVNEVIANGGTPQKGNFLLGTNFLTDAPGILFYPVTLFARLTPWVVVGLLALLVAVMRQWDWLRPRHTPLLLLAVATLLLPLVLTLPPKKFDRYALPSVPLLHILAACGLYWLGTHLPLLPRRVAIGFTTIAALATLLIFHPYYLAYYNPLIGGSAGATRLVPVGWGEGLDIAADWLNQQPDITKGKVATWSPPTLQAYLHTPTTWQGDIVNGAVSYVVVYINQAQTGKESQYFGAITARCSPVHTVEMHGIPYARIYRIPLFIPRLTAPARFGDTLVLADSVLVPPAPCSTEPFTLTLVFEPLASPQQPLFLFLHVVGPGGKVTQLDLPLASLIPPEAWQPGERVPYTIQLPLPADAPPGDYQIVLGLYNVADGVRLPIQAVTAQPPTLVSPDTLQVARFEHLPTVQP